jgi:hypothetical protein
VGAIAGGTAPAVVVVEIQRREARLAEIERERQEFAVKMPFELDERRLRKAFRTRLGEFDDLLRSDVPLARQALRKVIAGRIAFSPDRAGRRAGQRPPVVGGPGRCHERKYRSGVPTGMHVALAVGAPHRLPGAQRVPRTGLPARPLPQLTAQATPMAR